ncbi:MAG: ABC transporter permease subunit [Bacillota bacterium]
MKERNVPLLLGSIIIILLLLIMIFPNAFTDVNPYGIRNLRTWTDEAGKFHLETPPFPPSEHSLLGTDEIGRDIFSLIIHGTRLTLTLGFFVVLARFMIAFPMGIMAGFGSFVSRAVITQFSVVFSAIPSLLISIILLKMDFFLHLYKGHSIIAFVMVLTFVGWAKLGMLIMERVQEILAKPFIKGEIAIGKSNVQIAMENVIPHLVVELVVLFFMEIARALTMIMQLGIFGVFVGNLRVIQDTTDGVVTAMNISYEPEWASMLSTAKNQIRSAPWTVLFPATAFFISVLGFNLLGEGLRKMLQDTNSLFIPKLRRTLSLDFSNVSSFNKTIKWNNRIYRKHMTIALIAVIIFGWTWIERDQYVFNHVDASTILTTELDEQVIIGTEESEAMAVALADSLKNMGLDPLSGEDYIIEYETEDIYVPTSITFEIHNGSVSSAFDNKRDFSLLSFGDLDLSGEVYDGTKEDLFNIDNYSKFDNKFVIIDKGYYLDEAIEYFAEKIIVNSKAKGVFTVIREGEDLPNSIGKSLYDGVIAAITRETAEILLDNPRSVVNISLRSKQMNSRGRNVMAIMPGEDEQVGEEALMFGFGYNYLDKEVGSKKILFALEMINRLINQEDNRNRTLIFAFWDGTLKDEYNGVNYYAEHVLYPPKKTVLYFDLTKIHVDKARYIAYNADMSPFSRYFAFSFSHQFEENCKTHDMPINKLKNSSKVDEKLFIDSGLPTLIIGMKDNKKAGRNMREIDLDDLGKILTETIIKNNY